MPIATTVAAHPTANARTPRYFTTSSRVRPAGTTKMFRSVPVLASPATDSPETTDTASGRNNGSATSTDAKPRNRPFCVTCAKTAQFFAREADPPH